MARQGLQVALLVGTDNDYDRKIISGVSRYAHATGNWTIFCEDEHLHSMPALSRWKGDGVIAQLENPAIHASIARLRIPAVGVTSLSKLSPMLDKIVCVSTDNQEIGERGAEHLLQCGLDSFAYCGVPATRLNGWSKERGRAFSNFLARAGYYTAMYTGRHRTARQWQTLQNHMAAWLQSLKLPVGIMACDDPRARHVLEACRRSGLRVPETPPRSIPLLRRPAVKQVCEAPVHASGRLIPDIAIASVSRRLHHKSTPRFGRAQLTLLEHALCPLDSTVSLTQSFIHETTHKYTDRHRNRRTAHVRIGGLDGMSAHDELYL